MSSAVAEGRVRAIRQLVTDPWRAHQVMFAGRHPDPSSEAHKDLVAALWRPDRLLVNAFRGFGKSTYAEEAIVIKAALKQFRNCIIVGSSEKRAFERLDSIKLIIQQNEWLEEIFGRLQGKRWQGGQVALANDVFIQAVGREQSMRGTKHGDVRPDFFLVDDIEGDEEVLDAARWSQIWRWFMSVFIPALDHPLTTPGWALGTIQGENSFIVQLGQQPGWKKLTVPIEREVGDGREAVWPGKFPLGVVDRMKRGYRSNMALWEMEYMCNPRAQSQRDFTAAMIRVVPRETSFDAIYAMYDPARTARQSSATTGWAVWGWRRDRLIVWDGGAERWLPDEIIGHIFDIADRYDPIYLGFEEVGLSEWARQPIRREMARRGRVIPFQPVQAPRDKMGFIRGLQPWFASGEVEFAKELPELAAQLLSFPSGPKDAPNALAYALLLRPGAAIYEAFAEDHMGAVEISAWTPAYLACNADEGIVTAILGQFADGNLRIVRDWVFEGAPEERIADLAAEAAAENTTLRVSAAPPETGYEALKMRPRIASIRRSPLRWVIPARHFDPWHNLGLEQSIRRLPIVAQQGGDEREGRVWLDGQLQRWTRGRVCVTVSPEARWTLRALMGGYCRKIRKGGTLADEAEPGIYRTLMEGLESFCGMLAMAENEEGEDEMPQNYAYDRRGRRYVSILPERR